MFMNSFVVNIKSANVGCYMNRSAVSCILYADDIVLLSSSICELQSMLKIVSNTALNLSLEFNVYRSYYIALGGQLKL